MKKFFYLAIFFLFMVPVMNDMEDTLAFHYEESVFNPGTKDDPDYTSYFYPDWKRRYNIKTRYVDIWKKVPCPGGDTLMVIIGTNPVYEIISGKTFFNIRTGTWAIDYFLEIPAFFFDGWHLAKQFRWWMIFNFGWFLCVYFILESKPGIHPASVVIVPRKLKKERIIRKWSAGKIWTYTYFHWLIKYAVMVYLVHMAFFGSLFTVDI